MKNKTNNWYSFLFAAFVMTALTSTYASANKKIIVAYERELSHSIYFKDNSKNPRLNLRQIERGLVTDCIRGFHNCYVTARCPDHLYSAVIGIPDKNNKWEEVHFGKARKWSTCSNDLDSAVFQATRNCMAVAVKERKICNIAYILEYGRNTSISASDYSKSAKVNRFANTVFQAISKSTGQYQGEIDGLNGEASQAAKSKFSKKLETRLGTNKIDDLLYFEAYVKWHQFKWPFASSGKFDYNWPNLNGLDITQDTHLDILRYSYHNVMRRIQTEYGLSESQFFEQPRHDRVVLMEHVINNMLVEQHGTGINEHTKKSNWYRHNILPLMQAAEIPIIANRLRGYPIEITKQKELETFHVKYRGNVPTAPFKCVSTNQTDDVSEVCYDKANSYMLIKLRSTFYHYCEVNEYIFSELVSNTTPENFYENNIRGWGNDGPYDCRSRFIPEYN